MLVTDDTSHFDKSLENLEAWSNTHIMLITLDTFQLLMSELYEVLFQNIPSMVVTFDTSHPDRSSLNVALLENKYDISVTKDTHHSPIGHPFVSAMLRPKMLHPLLVGLVVQFCAM